MSELYCYEREPYRQRLDVEVLVIGQHDGRLYAVLDDTLLFPEGGGQPADHGLLSGPVASAVKVQDVQKVDGEVRHYFDGDLQLGDATLDIDWSRRFDHMQQHTAQHLLTAVAADRFGWATTSFHLRDGLCDIELDVASLDDKQLQALEDAVMGEVHAAHPVTTRRVAKETLQGLPIRSRGLPAGHEGDVRLVEIAGLDLNTCGGTHLKSTAEIESLNLVATESRRGGTRLLWLAGARLRRRCTSHESRNRELRQLLGAGDDELLEISRLKLEQLRQAEKDLVGLRKELAELRLAELLTQPGPWVSVHYEGAEMPFLQHLARGFLPSADQRCLFLTASSPAGHCFILARGEDNDMDLVPLGRQVAELLEGRGGGRGTLFQGKAESLGRRDEALSVLSGVAQGVEGAAEAS